MREILFAIAITSAFTAGCKKNKAGEGAGSAAVTTEAKGGTAGGGEAKPAGAAVAADPAVLDAAKQAATCELQEGYYYNYECPQLKAWQSLDFFMSFKPEQAVALVQVLEDKNVGVQTLAADKLTESKVTDYLAENKELQQRVIAVAKAMPKDAKGPTANRLGRIIGFFKLEKTGHFDQVKAIVDDASANENLRVGLANWVLAGNQESEAAYKLTLAAAQQTAAPNIRRAALVALSAGYKNHAAEVCALWQQALPTIDTEGDGDGAAMIAAHLTNADLQVNNQNRAFPYNWAMIHSDENLCPPEAVEAGLAETERRLAAGVSPMWWVSPLKGPAKSKNATPEQKQRAAAIATKLVDDPKVYAGYRGEALEVIAAIDPEAAKALATKYAADKDMKDSVARVQKKLSGAK
jgi:hypothetical protein